MTNREQRIRKRFLVILLMLMTISVGVGMAVPAYYDWTGADQSRPSPVVLPTAIGVLLTGIGVWAVLPWLPLTGDSSTIKPEFRPQFKIRSLLVITTLIGVFLAALSRLPRDLVSGGLLVLVVGYTGWCVYRDRTYRWPVAALLAGMYCPFLWVVSWSELRSAPPQELWQGVGLPSFLFALLLQGLLGQRPQELAWIAILLTAGELSLGLWVIRLGPRRTIAYLVFVLIASLFGSFILNALVRM